MEKANCYNCGNTNQVKVSGGFKKPENKGKKYFTCASCEQFQWVEGGVALHSSGLRVDNSKKAAVSQPSFAPPTDSQIMKEVLDENSDPSEQGPDWDEIRRQSFRFKGAMELIRNHGLVELTAEQKEGILEIVEFAMTGK